MHSSTNGSCTVIFISSKIFLFYHTKETKSKASDRIKGIVGIISVGKVTVLALWTLQGRRARPLRLRGLPLCYSWFRE